MLRVSLILLSGAIVAVTLCLASVSRTAGAWTIVGWAGVVLAALLFERTRYKAELDEPPGPDWVPTSELEVDAEGAVRVWYRPATGERAYVRAPVPPRAQF